MSRAVESSTDSNHRELWFVGPRQVELRAARPLRPLVRGEVQVRALHSGISQGTELLLYRGQGPRIFDPSIDAPGAPAYPRRYGYAWVGRIVQSLAEGYDIGTHVFALQPHGDSHCLRADQLRRLPPDVPSPRATLAANLETALTVVWDAGVALGDDVVVVGGGIVGLLCVLLAKRAGAARVRLVEPSGRRREAGRMLGADQAESPDHDVPGGNADVVIEATGDPAALDRAIAHAGFEATIALASFYGERRSPIGLGDDFHRKRLTLKSSQVSHVPARQSPRWDFARRFARVLDYLHDPRLDALLDPVVPLAEAPALYARLDADPGTALHSVLAYP